MSGTSKSFFSFILFIFIFSFVCFGVFVNASSEEDGNGVQREGSIHPMQRIRALKRRIRRDIQQDSSISSSGSEYDYGSASSYDGYYPLQTCPDGATCEEVETCCILYASKSFGDDGYYGCCPYPEASCCADHVHCCPGSYDCDVSKGVCVKRRTTRTPTPL
jgi:hypothetical protein